jgi:hypothetical protein
VPHAADGRVERHDLLALAERAQLLRGRAVRVALVDEEPRRLPDGLAGQELPLGGAGGVVAAGHAQRDGACGLCDPVEVDEAVV